MTVSRGLIMHLDTLVTDKGTLSIGIVELDNEESLNTDQLLKLVSDKGSTVLAVQLFDAAKIVDVHHLLSASQNAVNAWNGNYAQSRSLSVEVAVFASGQHQIGRALSTMGISDNLSNIAIVAIASTSDEVLQCLNGLTDKIGRPSEPAFSPDLARLEEIMRIFGIEKVEIEALTESNEPTALQAALSRCVVSRVSMVAFDT